MPSIFETKKLKILQQLAVPDAAYTDASPKGSVDAGIRALVDEINVLDSLVTTSSCAGRIAVYLEGRKKSHAADQQESSNDDANAGTGGKGGGQWLFVSHDPLEVPSERRPHELTTMFGMSTNEVAPMPTTVQDVRWVRCKFEPMILHILCSSVDSAQRVQNAALGAGFRESGISNISTQTDGSVTAMAGIRTAGLAFDSVIGYEAADGRLMPIVEEAYMDLLIKLGNERFEVNSSRTERFRQALNAQFGQTNGHADSDWEPTDVRKARKRAEGLARQAASRQEESRTMVSSSHVDNLEEPIILGTDLD